MSTSPGGNPVPLGDSEWGWLDATLGISARDLSNEVLRSVPLSVYECDMLDVTLGVVARDLSDGVVGSGIP